MKNLTKLSLLFLVFLFIGQNSWAQCGTCDITVSTNDNTSRTLAGSTNMCITGGTYSGNITVETNARLCITGGTFTGSLTLRGGAQLYVGPSGTYQGGTTSFQPNGANIPTAINDGTWDTGSITVNGNLTNNGDFEADGVQINGNGDLISNGSSFNTGSMQVNTGGNLEITGDYSMGALTANEPVTINGNGTIDGFVQINTGGGLDLTGNYTINGSLTANDDVSLNGNGTIASNVQVNSSGTVALSGDVAIGGALTNNSSLTVSNGNVSVAGSGTNNSTGTITINDAVLGIGGAFTNNGDITSAGSTTCGQVSIAGSSVQNSSGTTGDGGAGGQMDVCGNSGGGYDADNGTTATGVTNCTCETALPIELLSFQGVISEQGAQLGWVTATEFNNEYFEVQRSTDGREFKEIARVKGAGSSLTLKEYQYTDMEVFGISLSKLYYRLKQVDYDGAFAYSPVISVSLEGIPKIPVQVKVANRILTVSNIRKGALLVEAYNTLGRRVAAWNLARGNPKVQVPFDFSQGYYILHITEESTGEKIVQKVALR